MWKEKLTRKSDEAELENSIALLVMNVIFLIFILFSIIIFSQNFKTSGELSALPGNVVLVSSIFSLGCSIWYAVPCLNRGDVYIFLPFFSLTFVLISVFALCIITGGVFSPFATIFGACFVIPFALKVKQIYRSFGLIALTVVILATVHVQNIDEGGYINKIVDVDNSAFYIIFTVSVLIISSAINFFAYARTAVKNAITSWINSPKK